MLISSGCRHYWDCVVWVSWIYNKCSRRRMIYFVLKYKSLHMVAPITGLWSFLLKSLIVWRNPTDVGYTHCILLISFDIGTPLDHRPHRIHVTNYLIGLYFTAIGCWGVTPLSTWSVLQDVNGNIQKNRTMNPIARRQYVPMCQWSACQIEC